MADLKATERPIAKMLGVGRGTIYRDKENGPNGPNGPKSKIDALKLKGKVDTSGPNGATPSLLTKSGQDVARLVEKVAKLEK